MPATGLATADGRQLHLLLRHVVLRRPRPGRSVHHDRHHGRGQRGLDAARPVRHREVWASLDALLGRHRHARVPVHRGRRRLDPQHRPFEQGLRRLHLRLHLLLRLDLGSDRVGRDGRDLPAEMPSQMLVNDYGHELASERKLSPSFPPVPVIPRLIGILD